MGSTPPGSAKELEHSETPIDSSKGEELERLLKIKDQEIRSLKFQLEKYKLALSQSQGEQQQQLPLLSAPTNTRSTSDNNDSLLGSRLSKSNHSACTKADTIISDVVGQFGPDEEEISDITPVKASLSKESPSHPKARMIARQSTASVGSTSSLSGGPIFKSGKDDEDDYDESVDEGGVDDDIANLNSASQVKSAGAGRSECALDVDDELYGVIQDVGEIDLNLELRKERKRRRKMRAMSSNSDMKSVDKSGIAQSHAKEDEGNPDDDDDDEEDDIITDGLLTSLTDAAISNLSQLAALQERCESQDSSHHQYPDRSLTQEGVQSISPQVSTSNVFTSHSPTTEPLTSIVSSSPADPACMRSLIGSAQQSDSNRDIKNYNFQNPFSASNIANQAALAISAAAAVLRQEPTSSTTMLSNSPSSSISPPNSTIHADLSSNQSLASVVAAAAVAAAAANDQQQQHHHSHHEHNQSHKLPSTPQSRLISSALSSPEFYQNLHPQHQRSQVGLPQMSPISALHAYSPTTPITPSPSSLLAQSRRSGSNASSNFMSPISSPSYLRRQFMPDRLPMMSPSPSLTTGSSSVASTSLAHILQQHNQQRSASALAGPITSSSSTPLSGTGSSVMSPLISSKNSSQARLNNMQIRHKFGYLGSGRGQFNSPHGFCLGLNQEIVVADTNNHRICIFDKDGSYITQFGSAGKEEGQLWNPRKVAILHRAITSGGSHQRQIGKVISTFSSQLTSKGGIQNTSSGSNQLANEPLYVVCDRGAERSRMQLFTKDGSFIKKIGIHYIDIVAGLAITQNGLIIVVDSVSPTVYIINAETGTLNGWFDCSGHMKEPSDIAVKSEVPGNEYFICDFKGHCVVVFNEQGEYLRKIGHDGLTSYPNGIDISDDGDILVGDSHGNRFHVVVFDRNGKFNLHNHSQIVCHIWPQ